MNITLVFLAAYTLHRLLLQLERPEEAAKVRVPIGKRVKQRLDSWWTDFEKNGYYFEGQDVCDSPRVGSPVAWLEESQQAEVSPRWSVHGDSLQQ